jgi:hypothetical protein
MSKQRKITRKSSYAKARKVIVDHLLSNPCKTCGESDIVVLEFDHRDPVTKLYNISEMPRRNYSLNTIRSEIAKCDVLCANCHRRKTAK